ncbi:MAG: hypothetical protein EBU33_03070, partial [Sphingobacteriia bacterium]|nr:hypothetical protein [Sphingobacteriia bacterium]
MQTRVTLLGLFILINISSQAQRAKVQAAWRNLTDYEETLKEGRPELAYLTKANTSIDLALAHPDTKDQTKAHAYKMRIAYFVNFAFITFMSVSLYTDYFHIISGWYNHNIVPTVGTITVASYLVVFPYYSRVRKYKLSCLMTLAGFAAKLT